MANQDELISGVRPHQGDYAAENAGEGTTSAGNAGEDTTSAGNIGSNTTSGVSQMATGTSDHASENTTYASQTGDSDNGVKGNGGISTSIPDEYKGSSNQDLIDYLERKVRENKPLSDKELAKIRRRQKAEGIISGISDAVRAVSNLAFTTQYAPNMYKADEGMSARAKARFEKEKAERKAKDEEYFNFALQLAKLKGDDRDRALKIWETEQALARQDRAYNASRKDRENDEAFRDKDYDERVRQWQAGYDRQGEWHKEEGERWERQFKENQRQFNVTSSMERQRIGIAAQQAAHGMKQGQMTFNLGSGNGNVTLSIDKLNAQTVSRIYSTLPASVRDKIQGDPIVQNGMVVSYKPPTTEAMLIAIGANVENSPATQNAIKQVAGLETGEKPAGY